MKKILAKVSILLILFFLFSVIFSAQVLASVKTVGEMELTYESPFFDPNIGWYPERQENRTFTIKNLGAKTQTVVIEPFNVQDTDNFSQQFFVFIKEGDNYHFGGGDTKTGKQFLETGRYVLSSIASGTTTTYDLNFKFKPESGNDWQDKSFSFDLRIGFQGEESVDVGGTVNSNTNNQTVSAGNDSWQVKEVVNQPKKVTYIFPVLGEFLSPSEASQKPIINNQAEKGQVKGKSCTPLKSYWWLGLISQFIVTFVYFKLIKGVKIFWWWSFPLGLSVISQLIHELYFNCECMTSGLCPWYWLFNLLILVPPAVATCWRKILNFIS
jgi:hypothetical protein